MKGRTRVETLGNGKTHYNNYFILRNKYHHSFIQSKILGIYLQTKLELLFIIGNIVQIM